MDCKSLMIGDYIVSELGKIYRVKGVRDLDGGEVLVSTGKADMWYEYKLISPIPITEEILKANGFESVDDWDLYRIYKNIVFDYEHLTLSYLYNDLAHAICDMKYVHELQRILRSFGLWDLADNFKV